MRFRILVFIIISLLLCAACDTATEEATPLFTNTPVPPDTPVPTDPPIEAPTVKPSTLDILKEMEPLFIAHIDGEKCIVEGPAEVKTGEYLVVLHNTSDLPANLWIGSYFGEGSFEAHRQWREENCGGIEGVHCEDEDGNAIGYSKVTWEQTLKQAQEGEETYYKLYNFEKERQYTVYVSLDGWWGWPCYPFQVTK